MNLFYSHYDIFSLIIFVSVWIFSNIFSYSQSVRFNNLPRIQNECRKLWLSTFYSREAKITDVTIINTLKTSTSFFASTSILIVAGLIGGVSSSEKGVTLLSTLPFIEEISFELWHIKIIFLILIFIYAFFEFTWSLRTYNFILFLLGSSPENLSKDRTETIKKPFILVTLDTLFIASKHFNYGMRAYYFSLAALVWFIDPTLMIATGFGIAGILYNRDFRSKNFKDLKQYIDFYNYSKSNNDKQK
jgi:uncharacterized membrane protein